MSIHHSTTTVSTTADLLETIGDSELSSITGGESQFSGKADGAGFLGWGVVAPTVYLAYSYARHDLWPFARDKIGPSLMQGLKAPLRRPLL